MRPITLLLVFTVSLFAAPSATTEEADAKQEPVLELTLEIEEAKPGYGKPIRVTAVVKNRSRKSALFFHDPFVRGVMRFELIDKHGIAWTPIEAPVRIFRTLATPRISLGIEHGVSSKILPGGALRLTYELKWFIPTQIPERGWSWLSSLPIGPYTVRAVYEKTDALVPIGQAHWHPRLLQVEPTIFRRPVPGLFTGRLETKARIQIVAPHLETVDALRKRVRELEQENAQLEAKIAAAQKALGGS